MRQRRVGIPLRLQVLIEVVHIVRLVAAQCALDAQVRAHVIQIPLARLGEIVVADARDQLQRRAGDFAGVRHMRIDAPVRPVQIDDAARIERRVCCVDSGMAWN